MITYIMTMNDPNMPAKDVVEQKTERAIKSCEKFGIPYELIYGPTPRTTMHEVAEQLGVPLYRHNGDDCCNLSHTLGYKAIYESGETGVLMEYDGYWTQEPPVLPSEGNQIWQLCRSKWAEGYAMTPEAGKYFWDFRKKWGVKVITDHITQYQLRQGHILCKDFHDELMVPQFHEMKTYIDGNENADRDERCYSVRRINNGE